MTDHWMPSDLCPECGYAVDAATGVDGDAARPKPGDISLCLRCGAALEWDTSMVMRSVPEEALRELDAKTRRLIEGAKRHIKQRGLFPVSAKGQARVVKKA